MPFLLLFVAAMSGILPQTFVALLAVVLFGLMLISGELYLAFPVVLFYYTQLDILFGISVYRILTLLFLFSLFLTGRRKVNPLSSYSYFPPVFVYVIFLLFTLSFYNARAAIFYAVDICCILALVFLHLRDDKKIRKFFFLYVITALVAYFSGLLVGTEMVSYLQNDGFNTVSRVMATFNDPNYMGFYYSIAVFATVIFKFFNKLIRIIVIIALYVMILASLSITAIICNIGFWVIYLIVFKKLRIKAFLVIAIVTFLLVWLYNYALSDPSIPVLGNMALRIEDKLIDLNHNDINSFTTNRLNLQKLHWNYFINQDSLFAQFFGGNLSTALGVDLPGLKSVVAHNEYIDLLLNVGIIGDGGMICIGNTAVPCRIVAVVEGFVRVIVAGGIRTDPAVIHQPQQRHVRRAAAQQSGIRNRFPDGLHGKTECADCRGIGIRTSALGQAVAETVHLEIGIAPFPEGLEDIA